MSADTGMDMKLTGRMALAKSETENTDPIVCQEKHGHKFAPCQTESGADCCIIGDAYESTTPSTENKDRVDCFKTWGPKFEDCERDWGWDCCMTDLALKSATTNQEDSTVSRPENKERVDCFKTYGERFADCETELGWDCCFVGTEIGNETAYEGPATCSKELGPEFRDCGEGYGLDCCYVDDGVFKHDMNNSKDSGALKNFTPFYENGDKTCAEQFGSNFTDCGRQFSLDCCYIEGYTKYVKIGGGYSHRWFLPTAVVALVAIYRLQRKSKSSRASPNLRKAVIPEDDEEDDDENGDNVELRPLI